MLSRGDRSDIGAAAYWLSVLALTVLYDAGLTRWLGLNTISWTLLRWYDRFPWLWPAVLIIGVALTYHLLMGWWPFGGD